ncbi:MULTISPECIES: glycerophosphodiester phosphodiesterase [Salinivibrio]|uniref:glycerophosphodiester phosphodiesterase n=1 Tax=Salinivibrio TaxID=51366 RepID=UPI00084BD0CE|nr:MULTISPECIES: glycerophosphodiester phosphodiesterase [Salinivibrio]ODP99902.1 glycerophosphodiester phosphodiesterase [Salinivibrio sp. DV]
MNTTSKATLSLTVAALSVASALSFSSSVQASDSALSEKLGIADHAVIAHRGDSYNAPESTLPAYQLACEVGADYLELDLQRTKDGKLIAVHDDNLKRNTNIETVYPERADDPVNTFTWAELEKLDAGSWFNESYPERARESFRGLKLVTLDQVREIAEGCAHQPGLYIETKVPEFFPGIEKDLKDDLTKHGWLDDDAKGKVILQTFNKSSLETLQSVMPTVPKILLLWAGDGYIPTKDSAPKADDESYAEYYARQEVASKEGYAEWLDYAKQHGAIGVGPSTIQTQHDDAWSSQFSYMELAAPWMVEMSHEKDLLMHVYTVDQAVDFERYRDRGVDGFFTNRPNLAVKTLSGGEGKDIQATLTKLGY